ncbi:unnamed protein product [Mortierella alpina]
MTDIPAKAGSTNWGSYGSPASQSTSLSKRLSVRSPDDVGYVSSARRGNSSATSASPSRGYGASETSIGRLQKQISEQRVVLDATLSTASGHASSSEDRDIVDLKEQIRNAQARLSASSNQSIHQRLASGAQDLARLREERRNMDQEVGALLRTVSVLANKVREADKHLEESRLELAKLKSGGASSADAGIVGTGPDGSITAEDRMKARIALMKAQRMAALTGKPIPSAAQAGIDPDQAARIRAERDVNEQNVAEVESAVRRLEDTMRQLERDLDTHSSPKDSRADSDRRKWEEGSGVESEVTRRFILEIRAPTTPSLPPASSYLSPSLTSRANTTSSASGAGRYSATSPRLSSPTVSSASLTSSPSSSVSLVGKTPEERRAIIRAQAEKRLRDRQNDILAKSQSSRAEASSPALTPATPDVDAFTSAKFEEAERLAREKLLANAESKRRHAEQERQAERDMKAAQEKQAEQDQKSKVEALHEEERRAEREALAEREAADRKIAEMQEQRRKDMEREEQEERERKERFAQSAMAAKQQHQAAAPSPEPIKKEPIRITLDSNPFAKHRKSISSSDDDWDTTSPVHATPPVAVQGGAMAGSNSNNPFFRMISSNHAAQAPAPAVHSKDTSDGWDVVEKDVDFVDQLPQKLFSTPSSTTHAAIVPPSDVLTPSAGAPPPPPPPPPPPAMPQPPSDVLQPSANAPMPPPPPPVGASAPMSAAPAQAAAAPVPPPAPPAPAPPAVSNAPAVAGARGALLSQIQSGIRLKKAVTKDKSVTKGVGRVMGEDPSAGREDPSKGAAAETHIVSNSEQRPMGMPALGGLFAGGMPTLKKSAGVATGRLDAAADAYDSRRESTDWFGRLASHAPAENLPPTTSSAFASDIPVVPAATQATASIPMSEEPLPQAQQQQQQQVSEAPVKIAEESLENKVDFANGYRAKALWSYSAVAPDQVSLEADDFLRAYPSKEAGNVDWVYGVSEKDASIKGWLPKAYVQQVDEKFKAKVLFAYAAQNEGELSVQRGDIVEVMEKPDPQWWRAQSADGQTGVLPATYLEEFIEGQTPLVETPIAKAKVLYTYAGQTAEELSVDVGEDVDIMEKPDPLWWRVKNSGGDIGMLPATYLEELEGQSTSG